MGRLTLWGMQQSYPDLMSGVLLPAGLEKDVFLGILNARIGVQFPFIQNPPMLEILIGAWFSMHQGTFVRIYEALAAQYSPIENYDRTEERTNDLTHSGTDTDTTILGTKLITTRTGTETVSSTGSESSKRTGTEGDVTQVSAYDASSYVPRESHTRTPDLTDTRTPNLTDKRTPDLTDTAQNSGTDSRKTDYGHKESVVESIRAHGNIGVTTNQQMVTAEVEMRMQYNIYDIIIKMFEREFLSRVY